MRGTRYFCSVTRRLEIENESFLSYYEFQFQINVLINNLQLTNQAFIIHNDILQRRSLDSDL